MWCSNRIWYTLVDHLYMNSVSFSNLWSVKVHTYTTLIDILFPQVRYHILMCWLSNQQRSGKVAGIYWDTLLLTNHITVNTGDYTRMTSEFLFPILLGVNILSKQYFKHYLIIVIYPLSLFFKSIQVLSHILYCFIFVEGFDKACPFMSGYYHSQ